MTGEDLNNVLGAIRATLIIVTLIVCGTIIMCKDD
jgi:hypothetical protein